MFFDDDNIKYKDKKDKDKKDKEKEKKVWIVWCDKNLGI